MQQNNKQASGSIYCLWWTLYSCPDTIHVWLTQACIRWQVCMPRYLFFKPSNF